MKIILLLFVSSGISIATTAQSRLFVNPSANGQNNGQSWQDAFTNLHLALSAAQTGDELWAAEGEYRPDTATNRDRSFVLKSGVKLYGGFNGTETSLAQRDIAAHPTILSGNIGNPADSTDNSYTILYMAYPDTSTQIDGFTFRHGYAYSDTNFIHTSPVRSGAAVYVLAQSGKGMPRFSNCVFRDNYAQNFGAAYYVNAQSSSGSTPVFRNCVFFNNKAGGSGGAIYLSGGNGYDRGIEMDHCVFDQNHAGLDGGSIYWANAFGAETMNFQGCTFTRCTSARFGTGMYVWRTWTNDLRLRLDSCHVFGNKKFPSIFGAYFLEIEGNGIERKVVFHLEDSKIENNEGLSDIFRIPYYQSPFDAHPFDSVYVLNNVFANNKSGSLFQAEAYRSHVKIEGNLFANNEPSDSIYPRDNIWIWGSNVELSKNIFYNNQTPSNVYIGLFARPNSKVVIEDNVFCGNKRPLALTVKPWYSTKHDTAYITNNVFVNNETDNPGFNFSSPISNILTNNIFYGNKNSASGAPILPFKMDKDTFYFSHNLFDTISFCTDYPNVTCGPGNLYGVNPLFRDTANHDYSLLPCSPLINAGFNLAAVGILTDIAGNPRIQEGTIDIGAYEAPAFALASAPQVQPACIGASNGSITIQPEHGCEPLAYTWSPNAGNGPELNGLPPGDFIFTITDGSGRQISDTVVVASAPQPSLALASSDVQCGTTAGGSLSASVTSGTAPFQYTWLPNAADTALLLQQLPGDYALSVVDANGCQDSASTSIALLGMLTLMVDGKTISCYNAGDGWLSASPVTGAAPFSWDWQGWPGMDSIAQPLGPGNYAVTVSDAFGCTAAFTFPPMDQPDSLWATVGTNAQTDLVMPNGTAVVTTISGGTSPFDYLWEPGGSTTQAIAGLTAGTYTVTVTDNNGCAVVVQAVVDLMVGTEEAEGQAFLVYPNPAVDWLRIVLPEQAEAYQVELVDAAGRIVRSVTLPTATVHCHLDLKGLPSGTYFVMVKRNGQLVFTSQVIKG